MRSALYFDSPFDKIFKLSLKKSVMQNNVTISFAVISATNIFTVRIIGILQTLFKDIHDIRAVIKSRGMMFQLLLQVSMNNSAFSYLPYILAPTKKLHSKIAPTR